MSPVNGRADINMSRIRVSGIGGLGLVGIAALMTVVFPEARALVVAGALGGTVLGAALIVFHRLRRAPGPSGDDPTILFRPQAHAQLTMRDSNTRGSHDVRLAAAQ